MISEIKGWIGSKRPTIIYGAGRQGGIVYSFCMMYKKECVALMTSGNTNRWSSLPCADQLPLMLPEEFSGNRNETDVIIAIGGDTVDVSNRLEAAGFTHIYISHDWTKSNGWLRKNFFDMYFSSHGMRRAHDSEGKPYLQYEQAGLCFKFYYPIDEVYDASFLGDANNLLLPTLFHDESFVELGPYELPGFVELKPGDVVLDLGASIGDFAAIAAAKSCKVYAVEPNPHGPLRYLTMNAKLSPDITVIHKAVGDKNGKVPFYYNDCLHENSDMCRGSLHRDKEPDYATMEVEETTIDCLVADLGLERVDFIKSHTEDAEPLLLRGAEKTLKRFAPQIAMFRPQPAESDYSREIEHWLHKYQPKYQFRTKWKRFFASV